MKKRHRVPGHKARKMFRSTAGPASVHPRNNPPGLLMRGGIRL